MVKKFLEKSKLETSVSQLQPKRPAEPNQELRKGPQQSIPTSAHTRSTNPHKQDDWDLAGLISADSDDVQKGTSFGTTEEEIVANLEEDLLSLAGRMKRYAHSYRDQLQADKAVAPSV